MWNIIAKVLVVCLLATPAWADDTAGISAGGGIEPGQPWVDDGSTLFPGSDRDIDASDDTIHVTLRDSDTNTAFQLHVEDSATDPWRGLTFWQGTQTASGATFNVGTLRPSLRIDQSGGIYFNQLQTVNAARCLELAASGQMTLAAAACGTGGGGNSFETIAVPAGANAVALGTDTTNNYVATIADAGNTNITVANSGTETAAITLDVVDVTCTNCLTNVEVASADTVTTNANLTGEVTSVGNAATIADTVTFTGWVLGTSSATTLTAGAVNIDLLDGVGAVGMDYGSADITDHTFTTDGTGTTEIVLPAGSIDGTEILNGTIALVDTAITAGRSLTIATDDIAADAELFTDTKCAWWENPVATDDFKSIWFAKQAATLTSIWAESDQTVTFMLQVDDGTPADVDTVDLAPAAGTAEDTSLDGDATMAAGDRLDLAVTSVSGTPTWCSICWTFTYDD